MANDLHLKEFCNFWSMNFNSPIPPLPRKQSDLNITELEQLRIFDGGKLFQNLFRISPDSNGPERLPANLERDIRTGRVDYENKDLYRKFGYEHQAQEIEKAAVEAERILLDKATEETRLRNEERERINAAKANMSFNERMMLEQQSQTMDQVIKNRMKYHGHV